MRVGIVGAGTIAQTHLTVLAARPDVAVVFFADPDPAAAEVVTFRGAPVPGFATATQALRSVEADLVVIAAPTRLHAGLTRDVLVGSNARVLVEKPFVHNVSALDELTASLSDHGLEDRVHVAHHFAFSPEVVWAAALLAQHPEWGSPTRVTLAFHDPYLAFLDRALRSYESSWMDSGPNQLSVLGRFVDLAGVGSVRGSETGTRSWHTVEYPVAGGVGLARLLTGWHTGASSKRSTIELGRSGVEVWLDHTAMTGFAVRESELLALTDNDGATPRKVAHYRPLYDSLLTDPDPIMGVGVAGGIVRLLEAGRSGTAIAGGVVGGS